MENGRWDAYTVDGTTFGRRVGIAERGREREKQEQRQREIRSGNPSASKYNLTSEFQRTIEKP